MICPKADHYHCKDCAHKTQHGFIEECEGDVCNRWKITGAGAAEKGFKQKGCACVVEEAINFITEEEMKL